MYNHKITYRNPNRKPYGWKEPTAKEYKRLYRQNPKGWKELGRSMAEGYQAHLESLEDEELKDYIKTLAERLGEETDHDKKEPLLNEAERVLAYVKKTRPELYVMTTDTATNNLFNNKATSALKKYNAGNGATVLLSIDFSSIPAGDVHGAERLTDFDRIVLNAVNTIIHSGCNYVTINDIYKVLKAYSTNRKPTKKIRAKIKASMDILTSTRIVINNFDQAQRHSVELYRYKAAILFAEELDFIENGAIVEGWLITRSGLYDYAKKTGQLLVRPLSETDIPLSLGDTTTALRDYLRLRVHQARQTTKKKKKQTNIIKYSTLEERFNPQKNRLKRQRLKQNIKIILYF